MKFLESILTDDHILQIDYHAASAAGRCDAVTAASSGMMAQIKYGSDGGNQIVFSVECAHATGISRPHLMYRFVQQQHERRKMFRDGLQR